MAFATRTRRPPRTLTDAELTTILKVTGEHRDGFRDHVILSVALGVALREFGIVALNIGDVTNNGRTPKWSICLRTFKGSRRDGGAQYAPVSEAAYYKLEKWLAICGRAGLDETAPLFMSQKGNRLSARRVRELFREWQLEAGFANPYNFHALRHTALTNLYRKTKNLRLVQSAARHADVATTAIYTHVSDQEVADAVRGLPS